MDTPVLTYFVAWLESLHPEALVAWDRDVPPSFEYGHHGLDTQRIPTVWSPQSFFFEFVCDPIPHWRSDEDARILSSGYRHTYTSLWARRLHT